MMGSIQRPALHYHAPGATAVALTPDGATAASGGVDDTVQLGPPDPEQRPLLLGRHARCPPHECGIRITAVAISADGQFVASGSNTGTVQVWAHTFSPQQSLPLLTGPDRDPVTAVALTSAYAVSAHSDGTVQVWELTSQRTHLLSGYEFGAVAVTALAGDGRYVLFGGGDGFLRIQALLARRRETPREGLRP